MTRLEIAAPLSLSHFIPLNGFHPLYRALFDESPGDIRLHAWDNARLFRQFQSHPALTESLRALTTAEQRRLAQLPKDSIAARRGDFMTPANAMLTRELRGDLEFLHTAPYPSLTRPFVFHCESFAPVALPLTQQGGGSFEQPEELRAHFLELFNHPLCLGIFSHIPHTLESFRQFFQDPGINKKLHASRIGLSRYSLPASPPAPVTREALQRPTFVFFNSAHQNPANFFLRGGHLVLRFWQEYLRRGNRGRLVMRCGRPSAEDLTSRGVDSDFVDRESSHSILWAKNYISNHEMCSLLGKTHFMLLPSTSLHSVSIMQAMHLGVIPLVTDTLGTDRYVTDGSTGIVLQGVRDSLWYPDPATGILVDRFDWTPELENSLITQMVERIQALLEHPDDYQSLRKSMVQHAATAFSGQEFAEDFWSQTIALYESREKFAPAVSDLPALLIPEDCEIPPAEWERVFESPPQPITKLHTGDARILEMGGTWLQCAGGTSLDLKDLGVFEQFFREDAKKVEFFGSLTEADGQFLDSRWQLEHDFVHRVMALLAPYPRLYRIGARALKHLRHLQRFVIRYQKFRQIKKNPDAEIHPDIELVLGGLNDYNIVRFCHVFYAVPKSDGPFSAKKAIEGEYDHRPRSLSFARLLRQMEKRNAAAFVDPVPVELVEEGVGGFNILRRGDQYHAIRQCDGAFDYRRLVSGGYPVSHSGASHAEVRALCQPRT